MSGNKPRPILITILGILYILGALGLIILAIIFFAAGNVPLSDILSGDQLTQMEDLLAQLNITWEQVTVAAGVVTLILALIYMVIAVGLLKGWAIFWYIGVVVNILSLIGGIYSAIAVSPQGMILGIVINLIILIYMFTPKVKNFFLE